MFRAGLGFTGLADFRCRRRGSVLSDWIPAVRFSSFRRSSRFALRPVRSTIIKMPGQGLSRF